jgi:hypothetical protein
MKKERERRGEKVGVKLFSTPDHRTSSSSLMLLQLSTVHCLLEMPRFLNSAHHGDLLRN